MDETSKLCKASEDASDNIRMKTWVGKACVEKLVTIQ